MTFFNISPINFNIPQISFRSTATYSPPIKGEPYSDGFTSNPIYENYGSESEILAEAKSNPRIKEILSKYKIPLKLNMQELNQLKRGHMRETRVIAAQIYSALPKEMKAEINLPDLQEAAMFHDYGKVLIPASILNKAGGLTEEEHEIMQLHSELSYELLKNQNLSKDALNMIRNHHDTGDNLGAQILSTADKYSALREDRCYKEPLSREQALAIIKEDVDNGIIAPEVYEALKKSV